MSIARPMVDETHIRTWRAWWNQQPRWLRIACWAFVGCAGLHVALALRIVVGLREPLEITAMQRRSILFRYAWQQPDVWDPLRKNSTPSQELLMAGLWGRSWWNVVQIDFASAGNDEDIRIIARQCPNLGILSLSHCDISPETIGELKNCRRLRVLDLSCTDADDSTVAKLSYLKQLGLLNLHGTLVSDRAIDGLSKMPSLHGVELEHTDITSKGLDDWFKQGTGVRPVISANRRRFPIVGSIHWSDGRKSAGVSGEICTLRVEQRGDLHDDENLDGLICVSTHHGITREEMDFSDRSWDAEEYRFQLRVGEFESEPVIFSRSTEQGWMDLWNFKLEFRMPVTKAEALKSRGKISVDQ